MQEITKYALVTGASSGIGWHLSIELAKKGYSIVAVSNQTGQLVQLRQELITHFPIRVECFEIDLCQSTAASQVFDFCKNRDIHIEVLVNNAGILLYGELITLDVGKSQNILQLHMLTPAILCRLFGKEMAKKRKGYILNVSSISAVMPYPTISLYGPSKTFLRQFTHALRTELKREDIGVTCLIPGATATALYDTSTVNIPLAMKLGIMKKPEEVAKAGVKALFNKKAERIPGLLNQLTVLLIPLVPDFIIAFLHRKMRP